MNTRTHRKDPADETLEEYAAQLRTAWTGDKSTDDTRDSTDCEYGSANHFQRRGQRENQSYRHQDNKA